MPRKMHDVDMAMTYEEIAEELGVSVSLVASICVSALTRLRDGRAEKLRDYHQNSVDKSDEHRLVLKSV